MALAEFFDGEFVFDWPRHFRTGSGRDLASAGKFFTPAFLERHLRRGLAKGAVRAKPAYMRRMHPRRVRNFLAGRAVPTEWNLAQFDDLRPLLPLRDTIYRDLFERIGFTRRIRAAIEAAREVPLGRDPVAIHLRAGDVIHRFYRFEGRFARKVLAFPLAGSLAKSLQDAGADLILFGQDPSVVSYLRASTGCRVASDLKPGHVRPGPEAWFFEVALMARCGRIISGTMSSYSTIAARIGLSEQQNGYDLFGAETAKGIILDELTAAAPLHPLQKAHAYWSLYDAYGSELGPDDTIRALELAKAWDPCNTLIELSRINEMARGGQDLAAEDALDALISSQSRLPRRAASTLCMVLRFQADPDNRRSRDRSLSHIERLATAGHPAASLVCALSAVDAMEFANHCTRARDYPMTMALRHALAVRREALGATSEGWPPAFHHFGQLRHRLGLLRDTQPSVHPPPTPPAERPGSVPE
jgi:hypothetical protein